MDKIYTYKNIKILNKTNISKDTLHKLIDFCLPKEIRNLRINLLILNRYGFIKELKRLGVYDLEKLNLYGNPRAACCNEYYNGFLGKVKYRPLIYITIPKKVSPHISKPMKEAKKKGYLTVDIDNRRECIIHLLSHEFKHALINYKNNKNIGNTRQETLADKYGIKKIKEWRKMREQRREEIIKDYKKEWVDVV